MTFDELQKAWTPVLAWFDTANVRCPCKALVAPLVADWRVFSSAPDPSLFARQLCALRDAIGAIQRYAGANEIEDDPQWDPLREAIRNVPPGTCAALRDPALGGVDPPSPPPPPSSSPRLSPGLVLAGAGLAIAGAVAAGLAVLTRKKRK